MTDRVRSGDAVEPSFGPDPDERIVLVMIGTQPASLAVRFAVWERIDRARRAARNADLHTFAADARQDVEAFGAALADLLFLHEPRDGSPYCPGCSIGTATVEWPCQLWHVVVRDLDAGGPNGADR